MTPTYESCRLKVAPIYAIGLCNVYIVSFLFQGMCHKTLTTSEFQLSVDMDSLRLDQDYQLSQGISASHTTVTICCPLIDTIL